jgi:hypothetical protein
MRQHDLCSDAVGDVGSLQSRPKAELSDMKTNRRTGQVWIWHNSDLP